MGESSPIEEAAARWLLRRESPHWCPNDEQALQSWLDASTAHTVAYLRLQAAWEQTRRLRALGAGVPSGHVPGPEDWQLGLLIEKHISRDSVVERADQGGPDLETTRIVPSRRPFLWGASAAAALAVCLLALWRLMPVGASFQTPVGGVATVPIADGSEVTLNTNTRIRIALTETERAVSLDQGEAFFEVAKDPGRPFVVNVGRKRVVAVGTQFSVQRDGGQVQVIVSEGTVRMEDPEQEGRAVSRRADASTGVDDVAPVGWTNRSGSGVFLTAGSLARLDGDNLLVERKTLPEVQEDLSWRTGYLVFHDVPLSVAVTQFNRYNTRRILIDDERVKAIPVSGKFRATNYEAFVRLIEQGFPVAARHEERTIVLVHR